MVVASAVEVLAVVASVVGGGFRGGRGGSFGSDRGSFGPPESVIGMFFFLLSSHFY